MLGSGGDLPQLAPSAPGGCQAGARPDGGEADAALLQSRADWESMATAGTGPVSPLVRVLVERPHIVAYLDELGRVTRKSLISLHSGLPPAESQLTASMAADRALIDRGVRLRLVFPLSFLAAEHIVDYSRHMTGYGAALRFTDGVPHRLIVSDERRAMVPIDNGDLAAGACTTTSAQLVGGLTALASALFRRGRPLEEIDEVTVQPPTQMEVRLLAMLSSGVPDGVAARRLAISERTFRRYVTQLLHKLGAENRFQAGVRAVERGWL